MILYKEFQPLSYTSIFFYNKIWLQCTFENQWYTFEIRESLRFSGFKYFK